MPDGVNTPSATGVRPKEVPLMKPGTAMSLAPVFHPKAHADSGKSGASVT